MVSVSSGELFTTVAANETLGPMVVSAARTGCPAKARAVTTARLELVDIRRRT
jgi:hypothetical protein